MRSRHSIPPSPRAAQSPFPHQRWPEIGQADARPGRGFEREGVRVVVGRDGVVDAGVVAHAADVGIEAVVGFFLHEDYSLLGGSEEVGAEAGGYVCSGLDFPLEVASGVESWW